MTLFHDVMLLLLTAGVIGIWLEIKKLSEEHDDEM